MREEALGVLWGEGGPEPSVCELTRELEGPWAERREVDRYVGVRRLTEPQRLALAAGSGQHVVLARVADLLALEGETDDLDRLPHARERTRERGAVKPLDHLRATGSEAQDEPVG